MELKQKDLGILLSKYREVSQRCRDKVRRVTKHYKCAGSQISDKHCRKSELLELYWKWIACL